MACSGSRHSPCVDIAGTLRENVEQGDALEYPLGFGSFLCLWVLSRERRMTRWLGTKNSKKLAISEPVEICPYTPAQRTPARLDRAPAAVEQSCSKQSHGQLDCTSRAISGDTRRSSCPSVLQFVRRGRCGPKGLPKVGPTTADCTTSRSTTCLRRGTPARRRRQDDAQSVWHSACALLSEISRRRS